MHVPTDSEQEKSDELARASADLTHTREQFVVSMGALEQEIKRSFDWREWIRSRPRTAIAIAFTIGLFLGRKA
jgi:ElaB/YqjD/DUF883 family membrane-anchored ribosome-binding protein